MRQKLFNVFLLCVLLTRIACAQNRTITGTVVDNRDKTALPGVSIRLGGRPVGVTDPKGFFSVDVPPEAETLSFSFVGYTPTDVPITSTTLTVILYESEGTALNEVVVTGYTTVSRKNFAGATAAVDPVRVKQPPFSSFDNALQGQAAGVSVVSNSGQPGANAIVRIRGNGSINGSNVPLYILDGIEISAADFATVNQNDFSRVEILKDAVATSAYGSRGANGVIVITTRRGRAGQLQFTYDGQYGVSELPRDRIQTMNSQQKIDYELQRGNPFGWSDAEADSLRNVNYSWKDVLFRQGVTQQHNLSVSGGNESSRLFGSLSYFDQQGIVQTTGIKRYTVRLNADNNVKNWAFGLGIQGGFSNRTATAESNTFINSPLNAMRWSNPYERAYNPVTGDFQETGGPNTGQLTSGQPNGAMELFLNQNSQRQLKGIGTTYLEFHFPFLNGLYARTNWGIDYAQSEFSTFTSPRASSGIARQGILARSLTRSFRYTGTTSLNYKKEVGQHTIDAGLFTEVVKTDYRQFGFTGYGLTNGFTNEAGITPGSASNPNFIPSVNGTGYQTGIMSYFVLANYGYAGKYFVNLVGRRDGSSRFGANQRYANFGSVGVTWLLTGENFLQKAAWLNELKLRASFGTTGNAISSTDDATSSYSLPLFGRVSYAGVGGWAPFSPGNADLTWETNQTTDIGLDFGLWANRLSGTVDVYNRLTKNLFFNIPVDPATGGFTTIPGNFGSLRNRGVELTLRGDLVRTRTFRWSLEGNIAYNQNRILSLPRDSVITGNTILVQGRPFNSLYLVRYAGVNPANGNAQYYQRNGAITEAFSINDKQLQGTSDAPWYGGVTTTVAYKGFDLSAQLTFFLQRQLFNNEMSNLSNPNYLYDNVSVDLLREWRQPGDLTNVPRPDAGNNGVNSFQDQTTRFLDDASFWRLRNVTVGYTFSAGLLGKAKIRSARLFVQAQNWLTITNVRSFDPEIGGNTLTGSFYPALKQTTLGLSIGF